MKSKQASKATKGSKLDTSKTKFPDNKPATSNFLREFRNKKASNNFTKQHGARTQNPKTPDSKVVHPFAKYSAAGQLQCVLCSLPIPSGDAWAVHTQSRKHKDNMEILRDKASKSSKEPTKEASPGREASEAAAPPAKRLRSILKTTLPPKEDECAMTGLELKDQTSSSLVSAHNSDTSPHRDTLPSDFFDGTPTDSHPSLQAPSSKEDIGEKEGGDAMAEKLPEGFFDDPKVDAKKRGVKSQDPKEREWESFQRVLETEHEQSEQLVARQDQDDQLERDFSETHQQSQCYSRAEELRLRQESLPVPPSGRRGEEGDTKVGAAPSQDSDSGPEFNLDFDWRSQANNF